jgi:hypothetical protein
MESDEEVWLSTAFRGFLGIDEEKAQNGSRLKRVVIQPLRAGCGLGLGFIVNEVQTKELSMVKYVMYYALVAASLLL